MKRLLSSVAVGVMALAMSGADVMAQPHAKGSGQSKKSAPIPKQQDTSSRGKTAKQEPRPNPNRDRKPASTPRIGKDGFKDELIAKNNTRTKYFSNKKVDLKYAEKHGKLVETVRGGKKKVYCYPGKHHDHWKYRCWNGHYRCWLYWDPCCECYYHWFADRCCWAPVTCAPDDVPDFSSAATDTSEDGGDAVPPPPDDDDGE